ncbi:pantetheine-phosphate adenylyltransferase [Govanella unica]|uniref:Phosphopantetheine adenylyltransferase n=1 Tax=Govanella unica TaxID=2975056 RepID=A0A9X3TX55_9PROT|nr:pantetheine-phosphate adenylyltransferase [Govania unica]MDA5193239.1 pantetheine-phosphate adenylyltransferase [Govania unica]
MVKERVGLYPGTFDPLTRGHVDIIKRAVKLVDRLVLGVATNPSKDPLFTLEERSRMALEETADIAKASGVIIEVQPFETLLMHFAEQVGANFIIRGLRAVSDFEYEFQMAGMNRHLNPEIETVFLMAEAELQSIASRLVKEIAAFDGNIRSFVPPRIADAVEARVAERRGQS